MAVAAEVRRLGVATAMITALEAATIERGLNRVGLTVALDVGYAAARELYAKLGYTFAHGPFVLSTNLYDDEERSIPVGAASSYLTKPLIPR